MQHSIFFTRQFLGYCKFRLHSWVPEKLNLTVFVSFSIAFVKGWHFSLPFFRYHFYYFQYLSLYIGKQHRQLWSETVSNSEYLLIIFSSVFQSLVKGMGLSWLVYNINHPCSHPLPYSHPLTTPPSGAWGKGMGWKIFNKKMEEWLLATYLMTVTHWSKASENTSPPTIS